MASLRNARWPPSKNSTKSLKIFSRTTRRISMKLGKIDHSCSFIVVKIVTLGSKMGVARRSNFIVDRKWSRLVSKSKLLTRRSLWCSFCRNLMITSSKMAAERSKCHLFLRDFKRLLLPNSLANGPQTLHAWSLGEGFSKLLKWRRYVIQDGRRLKIAQSYFKNLLT